MIFVRNSNILSPKGDGYIQTVNELSGRFKLTIFKADSYGRKIEKSARVVAEFDNLILNQGLDRMGNASTSLASSYTDACQVGTGSTPPVNTNTGLQTFLAGTATVVNTTSSVQPTPPYYGQVSKLYEFGVGAAAGNLTEVGVGWSSTGANLFSRALIVDGSNNPITITVLSDEILQVTYILRLYPIEADTPAVVTISGSNYTFTRRPASVTSINPWALSDTASGNRSTAGFGLAVGVNDVYCSSVGLAAITSAPAIGAQRSSFTAGTYTLGNYFIDTSMTWNIGTANFGGGGIQSVTALSDNGGTGSTGLYQYGISPGIPKINTQVLTLNYRIQWARRAI